MQSVCPVTGGADSGGVTCQSLFDSLLKIFPRLSGSPHRTRLFFLVIAMAVSGLPLYAQKGGGGGGGRVGGGGGARAPIIGGRTGMNYPSTSSYPMNQPDWALASNLPPIPKPGIADDEKCFPWKISETQATAVSVARLQVPSKARGEFEKACESSSKNKLPEAEQHARNAIAKFQNYAAAWVELGLVLESQEKPEEAYEACSHAVSMDSTYLAGYLCEAEFSARSREWKQVLNMANQAEGLNAEGETYIFYYRAKAYLQMNNLAEAKKNALEAERADVKHSEPYINLLVAQIYEREGDNADAIAELQKLIKQHADPAQSGEARAYLARLESAEASK